MSATPMFMLDQFVATQPGEPFRLFPFGNFVKGGQKHTITPEVASTFVLPDFKPPIKLGSHDDETPAGGWIVGLEVRVDGLYAIPEYSPEGAKALADGDYRYQSPEVLWDGAIEGPNGQWIKGPMILGDALLHTPHLGEQAALFAVETKNGDEPMTETVTVPADLWSKAMGFLFPHKDEPDPAPKPPEETEVYKLVVAEREALKAALGAVETEATRKESIAALVAELQNKEKFGMVYVELKGAEEAASMMSSMSPEQREWCMRNFSALALQASAITTEVGTPGGNEGTSAQQFHALVQAREKEKGIAYPAAYEMVKNENPDLFVAAFSRQKKES